MSATRTTYQAYGTRVMAVGGPDEPVQLVVRCKSEEGAMAVAALLNREVRN